MTYIAFMFARSLRSSGPLLLSACVLLALAGCDRKESEPAPAVQPSAPAPSEKSETATPPGHGSPSPSAPSAANPQGSIEWDVPEGWKEMPPRPMRKATYQIDGEAGAAEVSVFYFGPGQGGGVEANIARWVGQFQGLEPGSEERSEREVNGMKFYSVRVDKGTFASGMPGMGAATPKENFGMLATIVQAKGGQYFFKLTGPSETVAAHAEEFSKMLDGIKEN